MKPLRQIVSEHPKMAEELPLVHTMKSDQLGKLMRHGELNPEICDVFQEHLVYLFYGRPAYKPINPSPPGDSVALCPMCLVFRSQTVSAETARVYPCDTGGVHGDMFTPHLTSEDLKDIELDPRIESARRLVSYYFDTNENYFFGKARSSISVNRRSLAYRFHQLLISDGPKTYDDRHSAIEVQIKGPLTLRDQLSFVVLPRTFLEKPSVRKAIISDWNCDAIHYNTTKGTSPHIYYPIIQREIEQRLRDSNRFDANRFV